MADKSWFYLTLWRGTPEEFTTELDAEIRTVDSATALIEESVNADAMIEMEMSEVVDVNTQHDAYAEIIIATEVIWCVG